jgi:hypothetical protein
MSELLPPEARIEKLQSCIAEYVTLLGKIEVLAKKGYAIAWHAIYQKFYPVYSEDDELEFFYDAEGCESKSFQAAVESLYSHLQREGEIK